MHDQDNTPSKKCSKCNEVKSIGNFYRRGNSYRSQCKQCMSVAYKKRTRAKHPPQIPENKRCGICRETKASSEYHKHSYTHDGLSSSCKQCKGKYDKSNRERFRGRLQSSPSYSTEYRRKWNTENRELKNQYTRRRRAMIKTATPTFADKHKIREIYKNRPKGMHVDHIIPIDSPVVCGLHVEWNLQYLTPAENQRKNRQIPS